MIIDQSRTFTTASAHTARIDTATGHERDQHDRQHQPLDVDGAGVAEPQRDVREQVERRPAEQGHRRHRLEGLVAVRDGLLEGERAQHDARDHREVEVRVGVAGQAVPLPARRRLLQPPLGDDGDDVEVDPPQRSGEADPERTDERHRRVQLDLGADAERDHRLAQGQDDDQVVAFGEVPGHEPPAVHAVLRRQSPVERDGERSRAPPSARSSTNDAATSRATTTARRDRQPDHPAAKRRVVS